MKGFLQRLFGGGVPNEKQAIRAAVGSLLEIQPFSHGLVRTPALDFFGPHAPSPNGRFHLIWLDRNPEGTIGAALQGGGQWGCIDGEGRLVLSRSAD